jgi:hypothetical protein
MLEFYKSPWRSYFEGAIQNAKTEITIVTPFIKMAEATRICEIVDGLGLSQTLRINVMTNLKSESVLAGVLDIGALKVFQASTRNLELVTLPQLHAKVYIIDRALAIVGSGNLTSSALDTNYEYSVGIKDLTSVSQIYNDMRSYSELGSALSKEQTNELAEIAEQLVSEYRSAQKSVTAPFKKRFNEALKRADFKFTQAFVGTKSANSVFSGAILYVLERGPKRTDEIHTHIKQLLPELCDDSAELIINGERYGKAWKHQIRNAQQSLKAKGLIVLNDNRWHLVFNMDGRRKNDLTGP